MLRFARVDVNRREHSRERQRIAALELVDRELAAERAADGFIGPLEEPRADVARRLGGGTGALRGGVVSWSAKSRSNLIATVSSLDLRPVAASGIPAMVTLTCPGDWFAVAPDAATAASAFHRWTRAYEKRWGKLSCIWKREFQRRGAPHWHLWMVPPEHEIECDRLACTCDFRTWLRYSWATALKVPFVDDMGDPLEALHASLATDRPEHEHCSCGEWCRSITAGTNLDRLEALKANDPRRLALYFLKESLGGEGKAYQNLPPREWGVWYSEWRPGYRPGTDADGLPVDRRSRVTHESVGRFWGVRGIPKAVEVVQVDPRHQYAVWRQLRRLREEIARPGERTKPRPPAVRTVRVARVAGDGDGVVRFRNVKRRMRTTGIAGWVAVNDGASVGANLGRFAAALEGSAARGALLARTPSWAERLERGIVIRDGRLVYPEQPVGMPTPDSSFWGEEAPKKPRRTGAAGRVWMP